jgi:hypothetical protein
VVLAVAEDFDGRWAAAAAVHHGEVGLEDAK